MSTVKCSDAQAQNGRKNTNLFLDKYFGDLIMLETWY
jgi:hypothetical protein